MWYDSFLILFASIFMAVVAFLFSLRLRLLISAVDLNFTRALSVLKEDLGRKTSGVVSNLLLVSNGDSGGKGCSPKSKVKSYGRGRGCSRGKSRGKSRSKAKPKPKATSPEFTGYRSLIILLAAASVLFLGEARWFSDTNNNGEVEGVNEVYDSGNDSGVIMEVCLTFDSCLLPFVYHMNAQLQTCLLSDISHRLTQKVEVASVDKTLLLMYCWQHHPTRITKDKIRRSSISILSWNQMTPVSKTIALAVKRNDMKMKCREYWLKLSILFRVTLQVIKSY